ncbi:hypothetical protein [Cupriavidus sp. H39]|uniref:hypothetical protein n=1 Tax=Cupriavidus sp. H39 TaxID=3401635 RepID=UPI003CFE1827
MENAPAGAFFVYWAGTRASCAAGGVPLAGALKYLRQKRMIKMEAGMLVYPAVEVLAAPPAMYAFAINSSKSAQFLAVMPSVALSEMPNLLSELDFSSYTIKTLLKSDVQPVQVVGPS